jgi:hypothetical protein
LLLWQEEVNILFILLIQKIWILYEKYIISSVIPGPNLIVAFFRQNEIISLWKRASSQLEKHSPWEVSHYMLPFSYWLRLTVCKRQTNAILNKIIDLFHNEIISFCQWKATLRLAAVLISYL